MKKCISMLLATLMLLTMIPTAFAAESVYEYTQPCVVDYFNSFNGFVKTSGTTTGAPEGFEAFLRDQNRLKKLTSETDSDGSNTYLKFSCDSSGSSGIMIPFSETIRTGKLHISFDMKIENPTKAGRFLLAGHNNYANDNPLDLMCKANNSYGIDYSYSKIMDINDTKSENEEGNTLCAGGNKTSKIDVDTKIKDAWKKYDIEINFLTKKVTLWLDGSKIKGETLESGFNYGLKSLYFLSSGSNDKNSSFCLDNLFIKHYPDGEYTAPEMAVDFAGDAAANSNAVINVAFSEANKVVNGSTTTARNDFKLVNIVDNTEIFPSQLPDKTNKRVIKLNFDEIPSGTYRVECRAGDVYKGLISQGKPTYSNAFSTGAAAQNLKSKNILVKEDFENYNSGMPANAEASDGTKTYAANTLAAAMEADHGTVLKMTGDGQQIIYRLPYALTGDGFTYEFDVKNNGGGWYTGLLTADALSGKKSISKALYDSTAGKTTDPSDPSEEQYKSDLTAYKMQTNAIGGSGTSVKYAKGKSSIADTEITDLNCDQNAWTHIKVDVDLNVGSYTVTIGEASQTVYVASDRFRPTTRYMKKTVQGEEKWVRTWDYGIKGISLGRYADSAEASSTEVYFDNLTVYNNDSYNDYQDFNSAPRTAAEGDAAYQMPGWLNPVKPYDGANVSLVGRDENTANNSNDKALKIEYKGKTMWDDIFTHRFNREVSGETPFAVEFDLKQDAGNTYNDFGLGLLQSNQLYTTYENTRTASGCVAESLTGLDKGLCSDEKKYHDSGVMLAVRKDSSGKMKLYRPNGDTLSSCNGNESVISSTEKMPELDLSGKWNHFKITVYPKPNDDKKYFTIRVSVTDDTGKTSTSSEQTFNLSREGMNFSAFFIKPKDYAQAKDSVTYLDNFKVYEIEKSNVDSPDAVVSNVYATEVNSINTATGEKALLGDGFKENNHNIEINFSAPIKSADDIKVYDTVSGTVKETTSVLSDKKTATLSFTGNDKPKVGEALTLVIPDTIQPDCASRLSRVEPSSVLYEVKAADASELKVENFRLYKLYGAGQNGITSKTDFAENWVPVAETELKDLTADDKFKFVAKGYNTGDTAQLWLGRAEKDPTTTLLTSFDSQTADVSYGRFELSLPVAAGSGSGEFMLNNTNGSMEAYLWDLSGLKPLCKKYGVKVTRTAPAETDAETSGEN